MPRWNWLAVDIGKFTNVFTLQSPRAVLLFALISPVLFAQARYTRTDLASPTVPDPISVYDNWAAYDELSDNVPLTEALSLKELDNVIRLKRDGVRFDYYVMDAFWFDPDSGYRTWKKPNWPQGPDRWIEMCRKSGIKPGLWFSTNTLVHLKAAPKWRDSLNKDGGAMSMFEGGFLSDFMDVLQFWYDRGIRMFLFDFADMTAVTPQGEVTLTKDEIVRRNSTALRDALAAFRLKNPDVVLEAFNGFGGAMDTTYYSFPFKDPVDLRWLTVFDSLYCGDPRPSDVPTMNFWRSLDIYSDHQMRRYEQSGIPLERIDTTSFMPGKTGTSYRRAFAGWKGSLLLMMARGGWINTTYGNLEMLSDTDALWFARAQSLFLHFQSEGKIKTFGGIPGDAQLYGFGALDEQGSVYTIVNPTESVASITLPVLSQEQSTISRGRVLFGDSGFAPGLTGNRIQLGPEQMAVVGFGKYSAPVYDLGVQNDVIVPWSIHPIDVKFRSMGKGVVIATLKAPAAGADLRLILQQYSSDGSLRRTWAGGDAGGTPMGKVFILKAEQGGRQLPVKEDYNRVVWAGLSWGEGEISHKNFRPDEPITLTFTSTEKDPVTIQGRVYAVNY